MNLFRRNEPATPEPDGITALRRTVKARNSKAGVLKAIAGQIDGLGLGQLEDFGDGRADLKTEILKKLATTLFPHSMLNDDGMLTSANREPPRSFIVPPVFDPTGHPFHAPYDPTRPVRAPQPVKPAPPRPKLLPPGWV